jgi:hypothetical protein
MHYPNGFNGRGLKWVARQVDIGTNRQTGPGGFSTSSRLSLPITVSLSHCLSHCPSHRVSSPSCRLLNRFQFPSDGCDSLVIITDNLMQCRSGYRPAVVGSSHLMNGLMWNSEIDHAQVCCVRPIW